MSDKKRVFITGASAGFGRDTAKALARRGHTVYATMRGVSGKNASAAKELAGDRLKVVEADVTDEESVKRAVRQAVDEGGIDVVINNAGVGTFGIDEGFTVEQARGIFDTNVLGPMRVNRAVLPHMRDRGKGLLVFISSGLGRIVFPYLAIYTGSKFAVEGYAESLSYELAPIGIQTVIVQPGAYGTTFLTNSLQPKTDVTSSYGASGKIFQGFGAAFEARAKGGGLGDPSEVVNALVEEVERESGPRPLRRPVGKDVGEVVTAINSVAENVQNQLLSAFGLKK